MHKGNQEKKVYGAHNKVVMINPYKTRFIATYPNSKVIEGKNLIDTGWDDIPNGLSSLEFMLSTGHLVKIPKFKAYRPLIEVSLGMDGSKIFHCINVECVGHNELMIYKIILKQDNLSRFKIGDIVISKKKLPNHFNKSWKYTS